MLTGQGDQTFGPWSLPDAGYYGWRDNSGNYIVCDAGAIGPDYIPGHAHADMFSFELSLKGHRIIVDSGTHDYLVGPMRTYCRSTRAHNTIEIDGQDQCEMWAAFRVARRGHPRQVRWTPREDGFDLSGWHDGYLRLPGSPRHARRFEWRQGGSLTIKDQVLANRPVDFVSRFHLHPDCRIEEMSSRHAIVAFPAGKCRVSLTNHEGLTCENSHYSPEFGVCQDNQLLALAASGQNTEIEVRIELLEASQ